MKKSILIIVVFCLIGCTEEQNQTNNLPNLNYVDVISDYMNSTDYQITNVEQVKFFSFEHQLISNCISIEIVFSGSQYSFIFDQNKIVCFEDFDNEVYIVYSAYTEDYEIFAY